jgi:hypothetical protein
MVFNHSGAAVFICPRFFSTFFTKKARPRPVNKFVYQNDSRHIAGPIKKSINKIMKKLLVLSSLIFGLFFVSEARAQTPIVFERGRSAKTITVTIPANGTRSFSLAVNRNQVINVDVPGNVAVNLTNGSSADNWQDGEGYLSVLTGRKAAYVFSVSNPSRRARTITMRVGVTSNRDDYRGGTE